MIPRVLGHHSNLYSNSKAGLNGPANKRVQPEESVAQQQQTSQII